MIHLCRFLLYPSILHQQTNSRRPASNDALSILALVLDLVSPEPKLLVGLHVICVSMVLNDSPRTGV